MKRAVILGSGGSIGVNAIRVVEALGASIEVVGLAVQRNYERVLEQAVALGAGHVAIADQNMAALGRAAAPPGIVVHAGADGVTEVACLPGIDIVVCAVVGTAGVAPVLAAVENGTDVALATKEVLVAAGGMVTSACKRSGARLLPIDSEHSALFQCLGYSGSCRPPEPPPRAPRRLILTASGGPFGERPEVDLADVTVEQALQHPSWNMGRKVTVDSATLMNKGLEIMEARWLFGVDLGNIEVVIHPESIVHSLVEFMDGSVLAQLSPPDMRLAIQYALTFPDRLDGGLPRLDLARTGALHFTKPDETRFPCLALARRAAECGGSMPAVLNAANEVAVDRFLGGGIPFTGIWTLVERVMGEHEALAAPDLAGIMRSDRWARQTAQDMAAG